MALPRATVCYPDKMLTRVRPEPDFFERVVGVPLDDWIAVVTHEQFEQLLRRRESPEPPESLHDHRVATGHHRTLFIDEIATGRTLTLCDDCGALFAP